MISYGVWPFKFSLTKLSLDTGYARVPQIKPSDNMRVRRQKQKHQVTQLLTTNDKISMFKMMRNINKKIRKSIKLQ